MNITNEELLERLLHLEVLMRRYQSTQIQRDHPLQNPYRGQGRVLSILKLQPEISQKELGYLLDMRNQSLGELLSKLEQKGYITRTPSKEDRRTMVITLTKEGEDAVYAMDARQEGVESIFHVLEDPERDQLLDYLDRLIAGVEQELAESGIDDTMFDRRFAGQFFAGFHGEQPDRKEFEAMMKERRENFRNERNALRKDMRDQRRRKQKKED